MTVPGRVSATGAICLALLAVFGLVLLLGARFPREAGLFPMIAGVAGLLVTGLIVVSDRADATREQPVVASAARTALALLAAPVFAGLVWGCGFYVASFLALAGLPWLLGYRRPMVLTAVAVGGVAVLGGLFDWGMDMTLPTGVVGEWVLARFVREF